MLEEISKLNSTQKREFVQNNLNQNITFLFNLFEELKKFGEVELSETVLKKIVEISIEQKRIWALSKLIGILGKRNSALVKRLTEAKKDLTEQRVEKTIRNTNFENLKIVEREILDKVQFLNWCESLNESIQLNELRIIYSGILIHGLNQISGRNIFKYFKQRKKNKKLLIFLKNEFNLKEEIISKKVISKKSLDEDTLPFEIKYTNASDDADKININLLDEKILKKYLNDILFSLFCLKDFGSIYKIEKIMEPSFKKNEKEYLNYNFYKLSSLLEQKKFIQAKGIITNELLNLPLTSKELMPFIYILGEVYLGLGKYEEALNFFLSLQKDKDFKVRAMLKINEIKKS